MSGLLSGRMGRHRRQQIAGPNKVEKPGGSCMSIVRFVFLVSGDDGFGPAC